MDVSYKAGDLNMESTGINIYKMPEQKCLRCDQPGHVVAKCPETTENY